MADEPLFSTLDDGLHQVMLADPDPGVEPLFTTKPPYRCWNCGKPSKSLYCDPKCKDDYDRWLKGWGRHA